MKKFSGQSVHNLSLFADDIVLLTDATRFLIELQSLLNNFSLISGYKVTKKIEVLYLTKFVQRDILKIDLSKGDMFLLNHFLFLRAYNEEPVFTFNGKTKPKAAPFVLYPHKDIFVKFLFAVCYVLNQPDGKA